jgi:4-hydroxy-tetrahydrodipicolinate reductase
MIRFIQYGCGKMSSYTVEYAKECKMELVGAVDINPDIVGKDFYGVKVTHADNFEELLKSIKPDIVVVETMSLLSDLDDVLTICASNGVNAITTCEEAFYPSVSNPVLTEKLDKLAKENGCTITGTGYQDAFWGNLVTTLAGATHGITKIKGSSSYNVEDYGIALAEVHGAGLTLEEFDEKIASADKISKEERDELINSGKYTPSYMWNVVPWIADKMGLHLTDMTQVCVPLTHSEDIDSSTLGMTVKAGNATGMSAIVTGKTEEGIIIEAECIGKVYAPGEVDKNDWTVEGEPTTRFVVSEPDTVRLTCATIVNRIPDVINADSGVVPTSRMGELKSLR